MIFKKPILCLLYLLLTLALPLSVCASEASWEGAVISADGTTVWQLTDGNTATYTTVTSPVTVSSEDNIHGIYILFDRLPSPWTLTDPSSGDTADCGMNGFLHEYIDTAERFPTQGNSYTLTFPEGTVIADIYAFSEGELPHWVQRWEPPHEKADLLLFSSHSDDEQLFFAGLLPLYGGEMGYRVQVAYMVQHFEANGWQDHTRPHEQLNGLWAVGVRHYPVMSDFPDLYSESLEGALSVYGNVDVMEEDFVRYITENLRRFRPLVAVTHDPKGEYGHGTHILTTHAMKQALESSADPNAFPESAERYGVWTPEKVYLHLYEDNPIVLDLDTPLAAFDGKTAFQVTQYGFSFHKSQHWTWFNDWIYGKEGAPVTKATEVWGYSPCRYGLYYTAVGADVNCNDMFENVKPYALREAEEAARETEAAETYPPETIPQETAVPETHAPETAPDPAVPPADDGGTASTLPLVFVGLLLACIGGALIAYIAALRKLDRRRNRRRNHR